MRIRTLAAAIAATAGILISTLAYPATASAADSSISLAHCNDWTTFVFPDGNRITQPSIGNNTGAIDCILSFGDNNAGVWILQAALNKCNGAGLQLDGIYGQKTKDVITWLQAARNVQPVDGTYGPNTRRGAILWPAYWANGDFRWCVWKS